MTTETKLEFGTTAWIDALGDVFRAAIEGAGESAGSITFSISELYTDVPAHISSAGQAGWACRITDGQVAFQHAADPSADIVIESDWATVQPLARIVVDGDPGRQAEIDGMMAEAIESGRMRVEGDITAFPEAIGTVHDEIARRTG